MTPPHDIATEQAVLASMMGNNSIIPRVKDILQPSDFYRESHKLIAKSIYTLNDPDLLLVKQELERQGILDKVGGQAYLMELVDALVVTQGIEQHAKTLKSLSDRRSIIRVCQSTYSAAMSRQEPTEELLSSLKDQIRSIEQGQHGKPWEDNLQLVKDVYRDIEDRKASGDKFVGVKTGFNHIDAACQGMEPKTTIYLIARPSIGKTALGLNIADSVAQNYEGATVFFSLESNSLALTRRRMAAKSQVYLSRIRSGNVDDSHWRAIVEAANEISGSSPIIIDHPRYKVIENLMALSESIAMDNKINLIVIDHIIRMRSQKPKQSQHLELGYVSEMLSDLAKNLNCPVLILCQLNRDIEKRTGKQYPMLSDIRESGRLEENADLVWGLWRRDKESDTARLECLKGRDTGTWTKWLRFDRYIQKFYELDDQYEGPTTATAPEV